MDDTLSFLVTVLQDGKRLLRCAVKVDRGDVPEDMLEHYNEPECRKALRELLPSYVRSCGRIVELERLFEVVDLTEGKDAD